MIAINEQQQMQINNPRLDQIEAAHSGFKNNKGKVQVRAPNVTHEYVEGQTELLELELAKRREYDDIGHEIISGHKYSVIVFMGGLGLRSQIKEGKEFAPIDDNNSESLFTRVASLLMEERSRLNTIYFVANLSNAKPIAEYIEDHGHFFAGVEVKISLQKRSSVLDEYGLSSIYKNQNEKLKYPNGTGSFLNSLLFYNEGKDISIEEHLKITKTKYLYGLGISNKFEAGFDYSFFGFLEKHPEVTTVFKYMSDEEGPEKYHRVCLCNKANRDQEWVVMEYDSLSFMSEDHGQIRKSPVWLNNFAINCSTLLENHRKSKDFACQFLRRKLMNKIGEEVPCNIYEKTISSVIMPVKQKCIGIKARKQEKFNLMIDSSQFSQKSLIRDSIGNSKGRLKRKD